MLSSNIKILSNLIITSYLDSHNESLITVVTLHTDILKTAVFFKLSSINNYTMAVDLFAIDNIKDEFRFTIIYLIRNINQNFFLRLITKVSLFKAVLSLSSIFPAFDWSEREVWDLTGIFFIKHPDLRRILSDYGFSGHPLRKDFPLSGFVEVQYSDKIKQVIYNPIELPQGFRSLSILKSWFNA